jgi:hypothetical protein
MEAYSDFITEWLHISGAAEGNKFYRLRKPIASPPP